MNFTDVIYFLSAAFMVAILFLGIDENFAVIVAFLIFTLWLQMKKITD